MVMYCIVCRACTGGGRRKANQQQHTRMYVYVNIYPSPPSYIYTHSITHISIKPSSHTHTRQHHTLLYTHPHTHIHTHTPQHRSLWRPSPSWPRGSRPCTPLLPPPPPPRHRMRVRGCELGFAGLTPQTIDMAPSHHHHHYSTPPTQPGPERKPPPLRPFLLPLQRGTPAAAHLRGRHCGGLRVRVSLGRLIC